MLATTLAALATTIRVIVPHWFVPPYFIPHLCITKHQNNPEPWKNFKKNSNPFCLISSSFVTALACLLRARCAAYILPQLQKTATCKTTLLSQVYSFICIPAAFEQAAIKAIFNAAKYLYSNTHMLLSFCHAPCTPNGNVLYLRPIL